METYMTAKEVAAKVRLSEQTIRRYVMLGQIPFHKIIRAVRFKPSEIEKWVEERMALLQGRDINPEPELFGADEPAQATEETGGEA